MAVRKIDTAEEFNVEIVRVLPWLIAAHAYTQNEITFPEILNGLVERDYQLWVTDNAACVTSITKWNEKRVCCLFLIGGERGKAMPEIAAGVGELEAYARKHNCAGLLGIGRALWKKIMPAFGFQIVKQDGDFSNVYFKELIDVEYTEGNNNQG